MSRIGKQPVSVPAGVTVTIGDDISIKGPKGNLNQAIVSRVTVKVEGDEVVVTRQDDSKPSRANHGLMRSLIQNMVTGVTTGFEKKLQVIGVGSLPVLIEIIDGRRVHVRRCGDTAGPAISHVGQQEAFAADKDPEIVPLPLQHRVRVVPVA